MRKKPASNWSVNSTGGRYSGILMDEVVYGKEDMAKGNGISITPEFKASGKDLRLQVKIKHKNNYQGNNYSTTYFSIIKFGPGAIYRDFKLIYEKQYYESSQHDTNAVNYDGTTYQTAAGGQIGQWFQKTVFAEFIIPNWDLAAGDSFHIGCLTDNGDVEIDNNQTYMIACDAALTQHPDDGRPIDHWRLINTRYRDANGNQLTTIYPPQGD